MLKKGIRIFKNDSLRTNNRFVFYEQAQIYGGGHEENIIQCAQTTDLILFPAATNGLAGNEARSDREHQHNK